MFFGGSMLFFSRENIYNYYSWCFVFRCVAVIEPLLLEEFGFQRR